MYIIIRNLQAEEINLELSKYKYVSLNQAIKFTRREFAIFLDGVSEMGISKHVIYQQLLEHAILAEAELRNDFKTDDHTIDIIQNSAKIFGSELINRMNRKQTFI